LGRLKAVEANIHLPCTCGCVRRKALVASFAVITTLCHSSRSLCQALVKTITTIKPSRITAPILRTVVELGIKLQYGTASTSASPSKNSIKLDINFGFHNMSPNVTIACWWLYLLPYVKRWVCF